VHLSPGREPMWPTRNVEGGTPKAGVFRSTVQWDPTASRVRCDNRISMRSHPSEICLDKLVYSALTAATMSPAKSRTIWLKASRLPGPEAVVSLVPLDEEDPDALEPAGCAIVAFVEEELKTAPAPAANVPLIASAVPLVALPAAA